MIIALIIVLTLITISTFWLYIGKRKLFERHKGIAEFLAVMVSLIFTLLALQQAQSSVDQSTEDFNALISRVDTIVTNVGTATNSIESVKASLAELPAQIDSFSNTIKSINSTLDQQKEQMTTTLKDFSGSIKEFQLSVEAMTERFNRKPKLVLDFKPIVNDSTFIIPMFVLRNEGTTEAELSSISIIVPNQNVIEFKVMAYNMSPYTPGINKYSMTYNDLLIIADPIKPLKIEGEMSFRIKPDFDIAIIVYYKANFGNGGAVQFNVVVRGGKIHLIS